MSIKQLLDAGGTLSDVAKLADPSFNNFGPSDPVNPHLSIKDSAGIKTGKYSRKNIEGLVKAAKATGINPYQVVALSLQESDLKAKRSGHGADLAQLSDFSDSQQKEVDNLSKKTGIDSEYLRVAVALRDKLKYAEHLGFKDEAEKLQAYNGYGKIKPGSFGAATKAYGVEIGEGIDLRKNPLYGKRVLQLAKDLQTNKDIKQLVDAG